MELSLQEAWQLWLTGKLPNEAVVWHVPIFWWGRIGITCQLAAAIPLLFEIVGYERLRYGGERLHKGFDPSQFFVGASGAIFWFFDFLLDILSWNGFETSPSGRYSKTLLVRLTAILTVPCIVFVAIFTVVPEFQRLMAIVEGPFSLWKERSASHMVYYAIVVSLIGGTLLSALCASAAMAFLLVFLSVVAYVFLRPVSFMLAHRNLRVIVWTISLVVFLLGGHFTLLAA